LKNQHFYATFAGKTSKKIHSYKYYGTLTPPQILETALHSMQAPFTLDCCADVMIRRKHKASEAPDFHILGTELKKYKFFFYFHNFNRVQSETGTVHAAAEMSTLCLERSSVHRNACRELKPHYNSFVKL
jgi:hypothetical protein